MAAAKVSSLEPAISDQSLSGPDAHQIAPKLDLLSIVKSEAIKPSTVQREANPEVTKFVDQKEGRAPIFYAWELKDKLNTMKPAEAKAFVEELKQVQKGKNVPEVLLSTTAEGIKVDVLDRMSSPNKILPVGKITESEVSTDTRRRFFADSREHQLATMGTAGIMYGVFRAGTLAAGARFNPKVALLELAGTLVVSAVTSPKIYEWFDGI